MQSEQENNCVYLFQTIKASKKHEYHQFITEKPERLISEQAIYNDISKNIIVVTTPTRYIYIYIYI